MGQMNAMGHVLAATASGRVEPLWDLLVELNDRVGERGCPDLHGLGDGFRDGRRYCLHPTGEPDFELRGDDLVQLLVAGCAYVARSLDETVMWRWD